MSSRFLLPRTSNARGLTFDQAEADAVDVSVVPSGTQTATDVQAAIDGLTTRLVTLPASRVYPFLRTTGGAINPAILDDITAGRLTVGAAVTTASYWEAGQLGGGMYRVVAAGTGTADNGRFVNAGSVQLQSIFVDAIPLAQFGPILDVESEAAFATTQTAFTNAIAAAMALGIENIVLPAGTIWAKADNGTTTGSGLRIVVPNNRTVRFFGQAGTVIKRIALAPPTPLAPSSAMVWMTANTGITIEWHYVVFDGNEANCEYDPLNPYGEEQSANLRWRVGSGEPHAIRFFHCDVGKNRVGDGYMASVTVSHFMAANCSTTDASVRRVRADWQFSRYARFDTVMANIRCNSWESEPSLTSDTARLLLSNVYAASRFDLAGDSNGTPRHPVTVNISNLRCDMDPARSGSAFCNLFRVHGEIHNSHLTGVNRIQRCKLKIVGGALAVNGIAATPTVADAVQIWHDQFIEASLVNDVDMGGCFVEFHGVTFLTIPTVATGSYLTNSTLAKDSTRLTPSTPMARTSIVGCFTPRAISRVYGEASRFGALEVRGGELRGTLDIVSIGNLQDNWMDVVIEPAPTWQAPSIIGHNGSDFQAEHRISTTLTSGTFTLTYGGQTTAPIAFNATTTVVQDALRLLPAIGATGVSAVGVGTVDTTTGVIMRFVSGLPTDFSGQITTADAGVTVTRGFARVTLAGEWNGEAMAPVAIPAVIGAPSLNWNINATMHVDSNPNGRIRAIPGLIAKAQKPGLGQPLYYRAVPAAGHTATGFAGTAWEAITPTTRSGNTAGRPTGVPAGASYLDTQLAPARPIWWTGTNWVDATGTIV